ncbi:microfibril-associated glycoprotein 4-like isoform X2 [Musca autumnalis]|uniref:microfibril-associated glycoprotein 4-like isoform X2 n=1 Tax=Musca autumnalis TaxID=221902 RepID=UPI003CF24A47
MKFIFTIFVFFLLLKIIFATHEAADNATSEEYYDPYEGEHILWRHLFIKVNKLLLETNKRQHEQERQMNDILKEIRGINAEFQNLQHAQDRKVNDILEQISGIKKKIVEHEEQEEILNTFKTVTNDRSIWTTIARRMDGSVDFYRSWAEYKAGFGNPPSGEFFIGLEKLHLLTTAVPHVELKIVIRSWDNEERYAIYDGFQIGNETEKYRIKLLGAYSGTAGDKMRYHNGQNFTTFDEDNDENVKENCAKFWNGAWWFNSCYRSHLFGPYRQEEKANTVGIGWNNAEWKGGIYSFKYAEMLLRPKVAK